ncbi:MAG: hypothetical protein IPP57_17310 [Candidatus Obscuribacter sp.]|nr:hypothetical protein [Candidatus Obscuribacter sp.]
MKSSAINATCAQGVMQTGFDHGFPIKIELFGHVSFRALLNLTDAGCLVEDRDMMNLLRGLRVDRVID